MNKQFRKKTMMGMVAAALAVTAVGCGTSDKDNQGGASAAPGETSSKPTEISFLTMTFGETPSNDLETIKQLNEKLNVKMNIQYVPAASYGDKINALLAANDLPDVTMVEFLDIAPAFASAIDKGAFWDLTPFIKDYPNLAKFPETVYENAKYRGKVYGMPRVRPTDGQTALIIRQDWLDKLQLQAPKTMDELYAVMDAFTNKDPDGNGKKDTYGIALSSNPTISGQLLTMFGAGVNYVKDKDNKIVPYWYGSQATDALSFWSKSYTNGLVVPDFPVLKNAQIKDLIIQGKAGMYIANVSDGWGHSVDLAKVTSGGKLTAYEMPAAADGKTYYNQAPGFYGLFLIKKTVSEDKVRKIMSVWNETATVEGYNAITYGVKDVDYTVDAAGIIKQTEEGTKKAYGGGTTAQWISGYFNKYQRAETAGISAEVKDHNYKLIDLITPNAVPNEAFGLPATAAYKEKGADWDKKVNDIMVNTIIGKSKIADWEAFVESYKKDASFNKHLEELNKLYTETKGQ